MFSHRWTERVLHVLWLPRSCLGNGPGTRLQCQKWGQIYRVVEKYGNKPAFGWKFRKTTDLVPHSWGYSANYTPLSGTVVSL